MADCKTAIANEELMIKLEEINIAKLIAYKLAQFSYHNYYYNISVDFDK